MTAPTNDRRSLYAGFWTRAAARIIDILIILIVYNLFYLVDRLGADAGLWSATGLGEGEAGNAFSVENFLRGVFFLGFPIFYYVFLHGTYGQTFGKMAMKIKLLNEDGSPIGYQKSIRRWLVEFTFNAVFPFFLLFLLVLITSSVEFLLNKMSSVFSVMEYLQSAFSWVAGIAVMVIIMAPTGIMFLWAAFDRRKQGLHDKICRTLVVKVNGPAVPGASPSGPVTGGVTTEPPSPAPPAPIGPDSPAPSHPPAN
ncbi:MAG: RDD family protein [Deltaproteobacteria bacterium]|nr:RDD family protein [Deltaproteobacteria bacterium]